MIRKKASPDIEKHLSYLPLRGPSDTCEQILSSVRSNLPKHFKERLSTLIDSLELMPQDSILLEILYLNQRSEFALFSPDLPLRQVADLLKITSFNRDLFLRWGIAVVNDSEILGLLNLEVFFFLSGQEDILGDDLKLILQSLKSKHHFSIWSEEDRMSFRALCYFQSEVLYLDTIDFNADLNESVRSLDSECFELIETPKEHGQLERLNFFSKVRNSAIFVDRNLLSSTKARLLRGAWVFFDPEESSHDGLLSFRPSRSAISQELWVGFNFDFNEHLSKKECLELSSLFPLNYKQIRTIFLESRSLNPDFGFDDCLKLAYKHNSRDLEKYTHPIHPKYSLSDVQTDSYTKTRLYEIYDYIKSRALTESAWQFRERHTRGHATVCLFKGQSGTGKTMAAEALAKDLGVPLYRVDLANLHSKYVGETEKNLSKIFHAAKSSAGILFFDEGEILFGRRSNKTSGQEKYANLETNYLLQELEVFSGIVIISTNLSSSIDPAFLRRITFDIYFSRPSEESKKSIWEFHLSNGMKLSEDINWDVLSKLRVSGGSIRNICQLAGSIAAQRGDELKFRDLLQAIRDEYSKTEEQIDRGLFTDREWRHVSLDWASNLARKKLLKREQTKESAYVE